MKKKNIYQNRSQSEAALADGVNEPVLPEGRLGDGEIQKPSLRAGGAGVSWRCQRLPAARTLGPCHPLPPQACCRRLTRRVKTGAHAL